MVARAVRPGTDRSHGVGRAGGRLKLRRDPNVIGRNDLIFPEGDAEALARILERLIMDRSYWEEVRAYGLARVRQHFTMERVAETLVDLWLEVLNRNRQGSSPHGA